MNKVLSSKLKDAAKEGREKDVDIILQGGDCNVDAMDEVNVHICNICRHVYVDVH